MSRPPTMPTQQYQSMQGPIVNGGLIDFHDAAVMQASQYAPQPGQYAPQPGQYIAGPPSFLHVNGQVYKPVPPSEVECDLEPRKEAKAVKSVKSAEKDIEKRVADKVEEFMARSTKPTRSARAARPTETDAEKLRKLNGEMRRSLRA